MRSKKPQLSHAAPLSESLPHSVASAPTELGARYFTPALFPRRIDALDQSSDRPSVLRGRSDSNASESYYTATWNTPNDPAFQSTGRRPHTSGRETVAGGRGPVPAGFVFGLDHLVQSRLPKSLFGDITEGPLSPSLAKQIRASQKLSEHAAGLFGDQSDLLTQARGGPVERTPPRSKATVEMLASRWAPTPDKELYEKEMAEKAREPQSPQVKIGTQSMESPRPTSIRTGSLESTKESPRKKKKVLWNGRQCVIYLPSGAPERFGGARPMSREQVHNLMRGWQAAGFDTNGFDVQHSENPEIEADRGVLRYTEAQNLFNAPAGTRANVRIADPKAWKDYENWLMEEKLRALGVGGLDEPPVMSRETSGQQQSRTFSPQFNAAPGTQGYPFSQRSTPGLSNFSTTTHSRTMSVASPLSSGPEGRGHAHRHSVFGMPQAFQQMSGSMNPTMRSFSPSQQLSLNAVARASSPGFDRFKSSVSPVPQAGPPLDGQPFRPSPVGERRFTPPAHMRHHSLAPTFSPHQAPAVVTPRRSPLAEVPEDEDELPQQFTPRAQTQQTDIVVPTPRGHRKNISENLEKEIRDAERMLEQQNSWENGEQAKSAQQPPFSQFSMPPQDSFSFKPPTQTPSGYQFGAPQNVPSFQPQAFAFQPQNTFGQPSFNPNQPAFNQKQSTFNPGQPTFQPQAPSFNFNSGLAARAPSFQPGSVTDMFPHAPIGRPNQLGHTRQQSSGNLNVTAPAFKPQSFGGPGAMPSGSFDFSSEFKPGAQAFQPSKPLEPQEGKKPIFGEVHIPDVVKPVKKSKAVAIIRPISSHKNDTADQVEEDETGRPMQSTDRQKRAFRAAEDDGDSVPLFATRPESHAQAKASTTEPLAETISRKDTTSSDEKPEQEVLDDSAMDMDSAPEVEDKDATAADLPALDYQTDENKENAPLQNTNAPTTSSHSRNLSSLSALAKPFEFVPKTQTAQAPPLQLPQYDMQSSPEKRTSLNPEKPDFGPARIFSRNVGSVDDSLSYDPEPEKAVSPLREATPPRLAELSFEPSFDEIDAVMRQLNEENDDEDVRQSQESDDVERIDTDQLRTSSPSAMISQLEALRSDAPSPGSVQIHHIRDNRSRSVSSMSEKPHLDMSTPLEMPSPNMQGPRNRNLGPSSEWSEDFAPGAEQQIQQRSIFDERVDEIIGKAFKDHLEPLQEQMTSLRRSLSEARPTTADSRVKRLASSGLDSDADDEDDVIDSKFLARPLSSRGNRKYDLMKAAVADALTQRSASPVRNSHVDLLHSFELVNSRLDTLLVKGFDLEDIRDVVQEAMQKTTSSLVHVPRSVSSDEEKDFKVQKQEHFDTKKLLRLAEEELDILRATISDKDSRLELLERERRDLRDRADNGEDLADRLSRKVNDLEAESTTLHSTLEEYRALRLKLKHDQEDTEAENRQLRATMLDLEGQVADGKNVRDNMRDKLDRIHTDMASAAQQLANQKVVWQRQNEDLQKRCAVFQSRLDSEIQLRAGLENEVSRLRMLASEGESAKVQLEQNVRTNAMLEDTIQGLRDEVNELQTSNSRVHRELQDARENSRLEVQRAQLMMQAGVETASNQADAMRAGLESKLSITANELENMKAMMEAMKSRHEILLQEEADLRRETLHKVNEASSSALENLRARHEEDVHFLKTQHDRALAESKHDHVRSENFWNERLTMSEERHSHLKERISHLEERLAIAKSAASAAAQAAQAAAKAPLAASSSEPERISPQALRESILVLQEQLQDRESRIERLQNDLSSTNATVPQKLKEKDIEISWLRELLAVRADDLSDLISTLSKPDFDRQAARDATIRIQTQMQIEMAEKERHITAGDSLPKQALAGITNFASPKAVQLAAAIGNWRARGAPSVPPRRGSPAASSAAREMGRMAGSEGGAGSSSVKREDRAEREVRDQLGTNDETPSKITVAQPRPGSAASWMSGLMTPPASGLRRTPSPFGRESAANGAVKRPGSRDAAAGQRRFGTESPATPGATPVGFRKSSFDADAGSVDFEGEGVGEGGEGLVGRSLARELELEPLG